MESAPRLELNLDWTGPDPNWTRRTGPDVSKTAHDADKRDLDMKKAKNKDITHDSKRTLDFKAECCQVSSRPQSARTLKAWGGGASPRGLQVVSHFFLSILSSFFFLKKEQTTITSGLGLCVGLNSKEKLKQKSITAGLGLWISVFV